MAEENDKVLSTKSALTAALGDNANQYFANMKMWFRYKMSKAEFDAASRLLLSSTEVHLHNEFFKAILIKLDTFKIPPTITPSTMHLKTPTETAPTTTSSSASRSRKRRKNSRAHADRVTFEPYDFMDFIAEDNMECIKSAISNDASGQMMPAQRYCVKELFLADAGFLLGRFLIGAWETGLVTVDDNVAEYVAMGVQLLLKNLISAIILKRKHYKVTGDGGFYYDIGAPLRDPFVRNTVTRQKIDDGILELDKEITSPNFVRRSNDDGTFLSACEEIESQKGNFITIKDVQRSLSDRNLVASHSVYAINMERITQRMH